ncbi:MAG: TonB-dependent receptor [Gammaproteobacteria bacterium]|nr:TonB-dependent receptor [Gammaproteobacteria bacterium]
MLKPSLASLACMHMVLAWAAPADPLSEMDYFSEQPVVLSPSRLSQPINRAPAAVTIITREMIEASGFRQLPDLLRLVPGFQVSWVRGNIQAVTYQGLSSIYSRRLQVMVDGRSVYNPAYGQVQWRGIPLALDDIDRIEVVRGSNAANDGVNAVQASIHIFTRPASADPGWTVGAAIGSADIRDGLLRYAGANGDWQWRATLNSRSDDWLKNQRDGARDHLFDARAEWRPNNRDEVTLQAGGVLGEWDESSVGYTFSNRQTTDFFNGYVQARWQRTLSADSEWSLLVNHTVTRADEAFPPLSVPPIGVLAPDSLNYWFSRSALEFSWQARPTEQLRTVWTAEARLDRAGSASLAGPDTHQGTMYRLSGSAEWNPAEQWVLHAGAMLEKHYYAGTRLSPRLAVNWLPVPGHSFRLGVSRAYRSPTFLEQESDFKFTSGPLLVDQRLLSPFKLEPERMDSAELGYLYHLAPLGLDLDVRLFHNRLDDVIDFTTPFPVAGELMGDGANLTYANLYRARQWGGEYQLRWQPGKATWLSLSQSWVRTRADFQDLEDSAPDLNLSLLASHDFGPLTGSIGYYRVGKMRWVGSRETPAYDRLDVRLSHVFKLGKTRAELAAVAQSILGDYSEYDSNRLFEPRAYVSLKLNL